MGEVKENPNSDRDALTVGLLIISLGGYGYYQKHPVDWETLGLKIAHVAIVSFLCLLFLTGIVVAIVSIYRHKKRKKEEIKHFECQINKLLEEKYDNFELIEKSSEKLNSLKKYEPKLFLTFQEKIEKIETKINSAYLKLKQKEKEKKLERQKNREQINKLLNYFI